MKFTKAEWDNFKEIGTRESSFDWDISMGYLRFGTCGMSVHKLRSKKWYEKHINHWRSLTVAEVNKALAEQEWEVA